MKISTNYLLRTLLRRAWIGLLAGLLLAGGLWLFRGGSTAPAVPAPEGQDAAQRIDPDTDPRLSRFALYVPDFSAVSGEAAHLISLNEYAESMSEFAAARFQTDAVFWEYYDELLRVYPALDSFIFTSDNLRDMITVWQYNYDVVLSVTVPELDEDTLDHCVEALGAADETEARCRLRDTVFKAVCRVMDDPSRLADAGITLRRADASYEKMMQLQSIVSTLHDSEIFAVKEGVLSGDEPGESRSVRSKTLALVFLLGFVLAEAVVALCVLLDPRVKDGADFRQNVDLPLLQIVSGGDSALTEAALRLGEGPTPVLLAVGVQSAAAEILPKRMDAGRRTALTEPGLPCALASYEPKSFDWAAALRGRPVVLAVQAMQTTYDDLKQAADALSAARADVRGAVLLAPERKGTSLKG